MNKKIELFANILTIVVAVLLIGLFIHRYVLPPSSGASGKSPTMGKKVSLDNFDWSKSKKNVLLVMQKGCSYCEASIDFYKKLIGESKGENVKIVFIFPPANKETEKYLNDFGVFGIEIRQSELGSLEVDGTPTIIVTNEQGEIINFWEGKLPVEKENEVSIFLSS